MNNTKVLYRQRNIYKKTLFQSNKTGSGKFEYGRDIQLYPLKNHSEKKVYYDKELNMYFESAQSFNGYEIEIRDVSVDLDKEVRKAEDLHRDCNISTIGSM